MILQMLGSLMLLPRGAGYGPEERSDEVAYPAGASREDAVVRVLLRGEVSPAGLSFGLRLLLRRGYGHKEEAEGEG